MNTTMKKMFGPLLLFIFTTTAVTAQVGQKKVTKEELSKFGQTFQKIRMMNQQVQMNMAQVVSNEEMDIKRFNEIHKASLDPAVEVETSGEEKEKYDEIVTQIEEIQLDFQSKIEETIKENGLTVERYQDIATRLQTDPELQERLKEELTGNGK